MKSISNSSEQKLDSLYCKETLPQVSNFEEVSDANDPLLKDRLCEPAVIRDEFYLSVSSKLDHNDIIASPPVKGLYKRKASVDALYARANTFSCICPDDGFLINSKLRKVFLSSMRPAEDLTLEAVVENYHQSLQASRDWEIVFKTVLTPYAFPDLLPSFTNNPAGFEPFSEGYGEEIYDRCFYSSRYWPLEKMKMVEKIDLSPLMKPLNPYILQLLLKSCSNATSLKLGANQLVSLIKWSDLSSKLTHISFTQITSHLVDYTIIDFLNTFPNISLLKTINFYQCTELTNKSLQLLAEKCPDLQSISFAHCPNINNDGIIRINSLRNLRLVNVIGTSVSLGAYSDFLGFDESTLIVNESNIHMLLVSMREVGAAHLESTAMGFLN